MINPIGENVNLLRARAQFENSDTLLGTVQNKTVADIYQKIADRAEISAEGKEGLQKTLASIESLPTGAEGKDAVNIAAGDYWKDRAAAADNETDKLRFLNNAAEEYESAGVSSKQQQRLGETYQDMGLNQESLAAYEKSVELDPQNGAARAGYGQQLQNNGDTQAALAQYEAAVKIDNKDVDSYLRAAAILEENGRTEDARTMLNKGLESNSGSSLLKDALSNL
jgi:tetratricopeptide (TPR) repeat protein